MRELTLLVIGDGADPQLGELARRAPGVRVVIGDRLEALAADAPQADAILLWTGPRALVDEVLALCGRLRWVHSSWAGVEDLLAGALGASPVPLSNARGVYSAALGEFALAAMLYFAKDLGRMRGAQAAGRWDPFEVEMLLGRTVGVIGYGDIGRAVASRARALGTRVLGLRRDPGRSRGDELLDEVLPPDGLAELMGRADYAVVALPLTPETRGFVGAAALGAMGPGAVLINVGRGAVVDEAALVRLLAGRRLRGAALDVFEREPLPPGHPLWGLDNVLLSPHCADRTAGWRAASLELFLDNLGRFRRGEALLNLVDKGRGY
jgi:phosphoglycerate dehydrogenase-like enzyme